MKERGKEIMIRKILVIGSIVFACIMIITGCSPDNTQEIKVIEDQNVQIADLEKKLSDASTELETVKSKFELTDKALKEKDESIDRLKNRIAELEAMIDFPEPDPNKKNPVGIGGYEFITQPRQNKDSKGDSDFD